MWSAIRDLERSRLSAAEKAMIRFVGKLNNECAAVTEDDIAALQREGHCEEAIYDAISVCALFNFYNRWIDGTGVPDMAPEHYRAQAKRMAADGYVRVKTSGGNRE
ncbi:MAG: hypothetical protein U5J83_01700 [Bryobacterales bacterium]|nr:hypothetical protein [Bryobacterales bacterium]